MSKFQRSSCIRRAQDFLEVKKLGKSARSGRIIVAAKLGEKQRLGIIASRRVGNAVIRNRLKRIIREYFRNNAEKFPKGDCVVIPGPCTKEVSNDEVRADLCRALSLLAPRLIRTTNKS